MSARGPIHAMLPPLDNPADVEAREEEMNRRLDDHRAEVLGEAAAAAEDTIRLFPEDTDWGSAIAGAMEGLAIRLRRMAGATDAPAFFQVGRAYRRNGNTFRVLVLDPHPVNGRLHAVGWMIGPERVVVTRLEQADWDSGKWTDIEEVR